MAALLIALALAAPDDLVVEIGARGLVAVAEDVALDGLETRVGAALDEEALTRDVRVLWDKELFTDVEVEKTRLASGWRVTFLVRERPLVRRVVFGGNDGFDDEALIEVIRSAPFRQPIWQGAADEDARRIAAHYRSHGWRRVEVAARIEPVSDEPGQADLLFGIREGPRAYVKELDIDGNRDLSDEEILDVLQTCEAGVLNRLLRGCWYFEPALETDLLRIQALYYDRGYVMIQVAAPEVVFSEDDTEVTIRVPVEEGGRFYFGLLQFTVKGVPPVFPREKLLRLLALEEGEVFDRTRLFQGIQRIQAAYRWELGTIVAITPESTLDEATHMVHLHFHIESPEPRYPSTAPGKLLPDTAKPL